MKKLMNLLMLSCMKAAALIDKKAEVKLSWRENVQLRMHTSMCDACAAYEKQSKLIDQVLHKHLEKINSDANSIVVNKDLKSRIISKL